MLADDDKDDRFFFDLVLSEACRNVNLNMVQDGEQLMAWLHSCSNNLPDILFLDLNMPRKNGFVCLQEIRSDRRLQNLFVAIYSTSTSPRDIQEAHEKGANIFVNKPNGYDDLKTIISKVLSLDFKDYFPYSDIDKFLLIPLEYKW